jgi:FkbM family methyltransferase
LIQGIVSGVFDLESNAETSSLREQYILCDGFMSKGDCVIDAGAYTGDTAELFSEIVGETGKVFSFEPFKDSFGKLEQRMLPNVRCINRGLYSSETELEISVNDNEPAGNSVTYTQYANKPDRVYVTTIDKFVKENEISKIDFIKMDVEGSELFALRGGYETIRRFRPNMAICIYHNYGKDAFNVPVYLVEEFGDLYEFSVKHHSIGWYETVMYAIRK